MRAVNLLPPDNRGASKASAELGAGPEAKGGAGAFVVLGVLAACVAGTAGVVLADNTIKQRSVDLEEVVQQQQSLKQQAAQLKPYADYDAMAKTRVQTVKDLAGSRFDWEQALRDLSRAVPADVTLSALTGDISNGAGGGGSALRGAISAPAITLQGCAPGQTQVARLMARLHDIDGVTRVSLSNSASEKVDGSRPTARVAERNAAPCGTGKRPKFEVVVFFEKDAAAVATTPTTSTGTVGETATPTPTATARRLRAARRPRRRPPLRPRRKGRPREPYLPNPARGHRGARRRRRLLEAGPRAQAREDRGARRAGRRRAGQLVQTQQLIATYQGARDDYKANYDTVVRLGKAVPSDDDTRSLVVQLDSAAKRSGVSFDTVNVNGAGGSSDDGTLIAPGAVSAGAFSAMPFTLNFTGKFDTLGDFFSRLERFVTVKGDQVAVSGHLMRVESINLAPGDGGWPTLKAQVGASSYIVPEATDPAAAAAATSTSTSGSTAATTTSTTTDGNVR